MKRPVPIFQTYARWIQGFIQSGTKPALLHIAKIAFPGYYPRAPRKSGCNAAIAGANAGTANYGTYPGIRKIKTGREMKKLCRANLGSGARDRPGIHRRRNGAEQ